MKNRIHRIMEKCILISAIALAIPLLITSQTKSPPEWNAKELKQALESARTAEDHTRIADYYAAQAERFEREAKEQFALAERLRQSPNGFLETKHPMSPGTVGHAQWLAGRYFTSAEKNRRLEKQQRRQVQAAPR